METIAPLWLWLTFAAIVLASLFVDFVVLKKQGAHDIGVKEALNWSLIWIALSFVFNGLLWWAIKDETGSTELANTKSLEFLTGYLIEKSLAVDNIFVFLMILVGGWLLSEFHWVLYVFGAFLVLTGIKMWWAAGKEPDLNNNPALKLLRRWMPISQHYDGERFWTRENGVKIATPLLMVISMIALTDVIFAVDSIPAIFAITSDPFIVLTSNVFAILGLRAMYFLLAAIADRFHLLNYGLAVVLIFIGVKMCLIDVYKIPVAVSLGVVIGILAVTMVMSLRTSAKKVSA